MSCIEKLVVNLWIQGPRLNEKDDQSFNKSRYCPLLDLDNDSKVRKCDQVAKPSVKESHMPISSRMDRFSSWQRVICIITDIKMIGRFFMKRLLLHLYS
jgi:hypothetical protein